jgi:glycosyltransferase involved in cell wall biosynthesis
MIVQPYRNATQSGVTQIAYHFEKPMLVTNVGGLPEIVPHKKVGYVAEINPLSIANFIADFYVQNREKEFSECTIHEKSRFMWGTFVKGIEDLYGRIIDNSKTTK